MDKVKFLLYGAVFCLMRKTFFFFFSGEGFEEGFVSDGPPQVLVQHLFAFCYVFRVNIIFVQLLSHV